MAESDSGDESDSGGEIDADVAALEGAVRAARGVALQLRTTRAPRALLAEVEAALDLLAEGLEPYQHPGPYAQGTLDPTREAFLAGSRDPMEFFPYSPIIGRRNPIAPPVEFVVQGGEVFAEHCFEAPWIGPPGAVHGGVMALVFDELLGAVTVINGMAGFTGTLTVRYLALTPAGEPLQLRGWIDRSEGRKTFARGTLMHGEQLCAEAEGVFITPGEAGFGLAGSSLGEDGA